MKKLISIFFASFILLSSGALFAAPKSLGVVQNKDNSKQEIIVWIKDRSVFVNMNDTLVLVADGKIVKMQVVNPMGTVAKCRLSRGYSNYFRRIPRNARVYKYKRGIEKELLADSQNDDINKGNSNFEVASSEKGIIFVLNLDDWYSIINTEFKKTYGKSVSKSELYNLTRNQILNPKIDNNKFTLSMYIYATAVTNQKTDSTISNLKAGNYFVWVVGENNINLQRTHLKEKETKKLFFSNVKPKLRITSNIEDADIYVNGYLQQEKTPATITLESNKYNRYRIKISKKNYESYVEDIQVANGDSKEVYAELKKKKNNGQNSGKLFSVNYSSQFTELADSSSSFIIFSSQGVEAFLYFFDLLYAGGSYYQIDPASISYEYNETYSTEDSNMYFLTTGFYLETSWASCCGIPNLAIGYLGFSVDFYIGKLNLDIPQYDSYYFYLGTMNTSSTFYGIGGRLDWSYNIFSRGGIFAGFAYRYLLFSGNDTESTYLTYGITMSWHAGIHF